MRMPFVTACGCLALVLGCAASARAQRAASVSPDDTAAIQALVSGYARALSACAAEDFADLFMPDTGYFASGFRGHVVGRQRLIALVQSERHCTAPAGAPPAARPGGSTGPTPVLAATAGGVRGVADLGAAGQYQDEYVKTPAGWRFASRTVLTPAEKAAGLDAAALLAIWRAGGAELNDFYVADASGAKRFRTSGVAISVAGGKITGRVYQKDGSYFDDVYEQTAPGQWRVVTRTRVAATP
jgi:hypothetical protein